MLHSWWSVMALLSSTITLLLNTSSLVQANGGVKGGRSSHLGGAIKGGPRGLVGAQPRFQTTASGGFELAGQQDSSSRQYAVIIDCGSSGSRVHVFSWLPNGGLASLVHSIDQVRDPKTNKPVVKQVRPGLSSVMDDPNKASDYLKPLLDFAQMHVPDRKQPSSPVYVFATAGLRLLEESVQHQILNDITNDLQPLYKFKSIDSRVISGVEEGYFLWLTANSHAKRLIGREWDQSLGTLHRSAPSSRRYGIIEMGGASTQVSFDAGAELDAQISHDLAKSPKALNAYANTKITAKLGDGTRQPKTQVSSQTFLDLGSDQARVLATDLLVRDAIRMRLGEIGTLSAQELEQVLMDKSSVFSVEDPCLPVGASDSISKPLELALDASKQIDHDNSPKSTKFKVELYGSGNFYQCKQLLIRLIYTARNQQLNCEPQKACSTHLIGTKFVPFMKMQFLASGQFFYSANQLKLGKQKFNPVEFMRRNIEFCSTPLNKLIEDDMDAYVTDKRRLTLGCFKATWVQTWLQYGLRMPTKFGVELVPVDSVDGKNLDWTFGALLGQLTGYTKPADATKR